MKVKSVKPFFGCSFSRVPTGCGTEPRRLDQALENRCGSYVNCNLADLETPASPYKKTLQKTSDTETQLKQTAWSIVQWNDVLIWHVGSMVDPGCMWSVARGIDEFAACHSPVTGTKGGGRDVHASGRRNKTPRNCAGSADSEDDCSGSRWLSSEMDMLKRGTLRQK